MIFLTDLISDTRGRTLATSTSSARYATRADEQGK